MERRPGRRAPRLGDGAVVEAVLADAMLVENGVVRVQLLAMLPATSRATVAHLRVERRPGRRAPRLGDGAVVEAVLADAVLVDAVLVDAVLVDAVYEAL
ncbi:MAG: hypothetical protein ACKO2G_06945 [Verrucomicrobiales bacterium]